MKRARDIRFNERKLKELMLYIAEKSVNDPKFGATKLNKILFYADFLAYGIFCEAITGAHYRHVERGPAPRELPEARDRLVRDGEAVVAPSTYFGYRQKRLIPLRSADLSVFSAREIALVDHLVEKFYSRDASEMTELSHIEAGWQPADESDGIPYTAVFPSGNEPTPHDVRRGQQLAKEYGWLASGV